LHTPDVSKIRGNSNNELNTVEALIQVKLFKDDLTLKDYSANYYIKKTESATKIILE